jgi:hypothetical protein
VGIIARIPCHARQDVTSLIAHILYDAFEDLPERAAGMNSERISEVLNFKKRLPPVASVAHLHALSASTTDTERELARLVAQGKVRTVTIPGRGRGGTAIGDGVVLVEDWKRRLQEEEAIPEHVKQKYILLMDTHPTSRTVSVGTLSSSEVGTLVAAGFLTNPAALCSTTGQVFPRSTGTTDGAISRSGFQAATGSVAAAGGYGAIHDHGGGGSTLATRDTRPRPMDSSSPRDMTFSLPSTGAYLKLLSEARTHLLHLLKQLSPRYREVTRSSLEEKWNGNVMGDAISAAKRGRGEWVGALPGQTKRWKQFYGMRFEWILAECMGAGLVELFDTGSVGMGVRGL